MVISRAYDPGMGPWPDETASLSDNEVIEQARRIYAQLQTTPRWAAENDDLIRAWGRICVEMGRRGISETVTEGVAAEDKLARLLSERETR